MTERLFPNRQQSRTIVIGVGTFWAMWGIAVALVQGGGPFAAVPIMIGMVALLRAFYAMFAVYQPSTGRSPWHMMFVPRFRRQDFRASLALYDLLRPSYVRHTLKETGWNPWYAGGSLLVLLSLDVAIAILILPRT